MAITLEANYSKKVGLPGYSSHQFSITLKTEIADLSQAQTESARLYAQLQDSVDQSICEVGWLPENNGNGHQGSNGNGNYKPAPKPEMWACTPKQRDLILKIVEENQLDKKQVEALAMERFNLGVKQLNTLQTSQIIKELLEIYPGNNGNGNGNNQAKGNGNGNGTYSRRPYSRSIPTTMRSP